MNFYSEIQSKKEIKSIFEFWIQNKSWNQMQIIFDFDLKYRKTQKMIKFYADFKPKNICI